MNVILAKNLRVPAEKVEVWLILLFLLPGKNMRTYIVKREHFLKNALVQSSIVQSISKADAVTSFKMQYCREIIMGLISLSQISVHVGLSSVFA